MLAVRVTRPDGQDRPLGRDVKLVGMIQNGPPAACYWGGWDTDAPHWKGRFIKGQLRLDRDGSFALAGIQMGSDAETTSVWHPFLLAADSAGCAALAANLAKTGGIGGYSRNALPQGVTLIYYGEPVARDI